MTMAPQISADLSHVAQLTRNIPIVMLTPIDGDEALVSRHRSALETDAQGARDPPKQMGEGEVARVMPSNPIALGGTSARQMLRRTDCEPEAPSG
jgi:hypothetical protein